MKKIVLCFVSICVLFSSCDKKDKVIDTEVQIFGTVQDKNSLQMLSGVVISSDSLQIGNVVTGNDGYFSFIISYNTNRKINLVALKNNYESETQILNLKDISNNPQKSVDFMLRRSAIIYKGIVSDAQTSQPIPNAKVHAKIQNGSYIGAAGTIFANKDGLYTLELEKPDNYTSWTYHITASKDNYKSQTYSLSHTRADIGKTESLNFSLESKE